MRAEAGKYKKLLNLGARKFISRNTRNFFVRGGFFYFFEVGLKSAPYYTTDRKQTILTWPNFKRF